MKTALEFEFWHDLAKYCNSNWKGYFSDVELINYAEDNLYEWEDSIKTKRLSYTISQLLDSLLEDKANGSEDALYYINKIKKEIKRHQIKEN